MRARKVAEAISGQLPLLEVVAGHDTARDLEALPDLSISEPNFRLLARMKRGVDIRIALDPDGVEVSDALMASVCSRLTGRAPNWRVLGDGDLRIQFNVAGSEGPDGDAAWAFANGMCQVLQRRLSAIRRVEFFDYCDYLTPEARERIDSL